MAFSNIYIRFLLCLSITLLTSSCLLAQFDPIGGVPENLSSRLVELDGQVYTASGQKIYRYIDSLEHWEEAGTVPLDEDNEPFYIRQLFAWDTILYSSVFNEGVFRSEDKAQTWTKVGSFNQVGYFDHKFHQANDSIIYLTYFNGLLVSTDGGESFTSRPLPPNLGGCVYLNEVGYCLERDFPAINLIRSEDHFETFTTQSFNLDNNQPEDLTAFKGQLVMIADEIYSSTDEGENWQLFDLPDIDPEGPFSPFYHWSIKNDSLFIIDADGKAYVTGDSTLQSWETIAVDIPNLLLVDNGPSAFYILKTDDSYWYSYSTFYQKKHGESGWFERIDGIKNGPSYNFFEDQGVLYQVNNNGLYRSGDNGRTFELLRSPVLANEVQSYELEWVRFRKIDSLFFCATPTGLFRSTNNWGTYSQVLADNVREVKMYSDTLWTLTRDALYYSVDTGLNWSLQSDAVFNGNERGVDFYKSGNNVTVFLKQYLGSSSGSVLSSTDNGLNFSTFWDDNLRSFAAREDTLVFDGGNNNFVASFDGGENWLTASTPAGINLTFGLAINEQGVVMAATPQGIYATNNWGQNWLSVYPQVFGNQQFDDAVFVNGEFLMYSANQGIYSFGENLINCFFDPESNGDCKVIAGKVYQDDNQNCSVEENESSIRSHIIELLPDSIYLATNSDGTYAVSVEDGNYQIKTQHPFGYYWEATCPDDLGYDINIPADSLLLQQLDFGFYLPDTIRDLAVSIIQMGSTRINEPMHFSLLCENRGSVGIPPELSFAYPLGFGFVNSSVDPDTQVEGLLEWSQLDTLWPGQTLQILLTLQIPNDVNLLGDTVAFDLLAEPVITDLMPEDNTHSELVVIVGAYDPNDKQVIPAGTGENGEIPPGIEEFIYTIRFQNTGNSFARRVELRDTLHPLLNPLSFRMIGASHDYDFSIRDNRTMVWDFNDINLPDSTSNERESHGFVRFSLQAYEDLTVGQQITNRAGIYFDANPPIITNRVVNTVVNTVNTQAPDTQVKRFDWHPNPAQDYLQINYLEDRFLEAGWTLQLYNSLGSEVLRRPLTDVAHQLDLQQAGLQPGLYYLLIKGPEGYWQSGKVLVL